MAEVRQDGSASTNGPEREPRGFSEHTRKAPSENAHEQGWGLDQDERTRMPEEKQAWEGGRDYDYGARDFGDVPTDTSAAKPNPRPTHKTAFAKREAAKTEPLRSGLDRGCYRTSASRG